MEAESSSKIKAIKVARSSLTINHLFFANDSLIFCRATTSDWLEVKNVLERYEKATSQGVNNINLGSFSAQKLVLLQKKILSFSGVSNCYNSKKVSRTLNDGGKEQESQI